uniref:Uncharacterized protein n=1 Tax=Solanum lycopersicum TaxID=4081 RepID=A0A3Q7HEI7_SOLLC
CIGINFYQLYLFK